MACRSERWKGGSTKKKKANPLERESMKERQQRRCGFPKVSTEETKQRDFKPVEKQQLLA